MTHQPSLARLAALVKAKRRELNLSLREVARLSGISPSTLSRLERGIAPALPDAETLEKIAQWMGVPVDELIAAPSPGQPPLNRSGQVPELSTPEVVEVHLRADKNLSPQTARALAELFKLAYEQFTRIPPEEEEDPKD